MPLPLVTERLRLRRPTIDVLDAWLAISREAEAVWFGEPRSNLEEARANLDRHMEHHERHGFGLCAVELRASGDVVGAAGLKHLADGPEIELGYRFREQHRGKGYATEAARASIEFGFEVLGLKRIVAVALPDNTASLRVMEKCGMRMIGTQDVYGGEHVKYALDR